MIINTAGQTGLGPDFCFIIGGCDLFSTVITITIITAVGLGNEVPFVS